MPRFINTNDNKIITFNNHGIKPIYILRNIGEDYINDTIANSSQWESSIIEFAKKFYLSKTDFLDIGANIGVWSVEFGKLSNGNIFSFEPIPNTFNQLCGNIFVNYLSNVKLCNLALGHEKGSFQMYIPEAFNIGAYKSVDDNFDNENITHRNSLITVRVTTLDRYFEKYIKESINISLIKIDVEGYEINVLKGGYKLIKKHRPVIFFESWNNFTNQIHIDLQKNLFEYFWKIEYKIFHFKLDDYYAIPFEKLDLYSHLTNY
jgi:FkbM family methyltransferase